MPLVAIHYAFRTTAYLLWMHLELYYVWQSCLSASTVWALWLDFTMVKIKVGEKKKKKVETTEGASVSKSSLQPSRKSFSVVMPQGVTHRGCTSRLEIRRALCASCADLELARLLVTLSSCHPHLGHLLDLLPAEVSTLFSQTLRQSDRCSWKAGPGMLHLGFRLGGLLVRGLLSLGTARISKTKEKVVQLRFIYLFFLFGVHHFSASVSVMVEAKISLQHEGSRITNFGWEGHDVVHS